MRIKATVLGKEEATYQYAERYKRRGRERAPKKHISDFDQDWANWYGKRTAIGNAPVADFKRSPDHGARAQDIMGVFAGAYKPQKSKEKGFVLVGNMGSCPRTLMKWEPRPITTGRGSYIEIKYDPYIYPCVVDHGNKWAKGQGMLRRLVPVTGKKNEHRDSLGRTW